MTTLGRGHATNAEAISPVDVWHGQRRPDDSRQTRDVGHLLGRLVLLDLLDKDIIGVDHAVDAHFLLVGFRDAPFGAVDSL